MIQVTKVWWDGEKLMAEPIDPTTIYQEPAQEKDWGAVGKAHIAAIKKSSKAMVEDAAVRAVHKVMAEFEAKSDERLMEQPAQQEPVAWRDHVEQRLRTWRQSFVNRSGDQLALDDFMDKRSLDDLIDFVCDEYTSPPAQRKPLTDEQIDKLPWGPHEGNPMTFAEGLRDFARAIEDAHGIKENT